VNGEWDLFDYSHDPSHPPGNFGVQVIAIPEPTTVALGLLGAAGWLGCRAARRRRDGC